MQIGKEEEKLSWCAGDMIVYIEIPIDSTKKLLNLISEFGKTAGYKVNMHKSKAFWYTTNEISKTGIRKISHLCSTKENKVLGVNLTQAVKDLYSQH